MKRKRSTPPAAGRQARRDPEAAQEAQQKETRQERKDRILARAEDLLKRARKGETPEEIIDKGLALAELKRIRPWNYDGSKGAFNKYVRNKLNYKPARAYDYIRVATNVRLDLVAGKLLTFEALLILADADAELHQMLIEAALRGATTRELRQLAFGQEVPDPNDPEERAQRVVRLQKKQATELQLLVEQIGKGAQVTSEVLGQIAKEGKVQAGLIAELGGKKGGDQGGGGGQDLDPRGSNPGSSGGEAPEARPAPEPEPKPAPTPPAPPEPEPAPPEPKPAPPPEPKPAQPEPEPQPEPKPPEPKAAQPEPRSPEPKPPEPEPKPAQPEPKPDQPRPNKSSQEAFYDLCVDYEPQPLLRVPLNMPLPQDWPQDWFQQWVSTPAYSADPILLCASSPSPQWGTLGLTMEDGFRVGINLNGSSCSYIFSTPGGGKTYASDNITHMSIQPLHHVNRLPKPLLAIQLYYHHDETRDPEALSLRHPNRDHYEVQHLVEEMGAFPEGIKDIVLVCPASRVQSMRKRFPHVRVFPLLFATPELRATEFQGLLDINDPNDNRLYTRQIRQALKGLVMPLLPEVEQALEDVDLSPEGRRLVDARLSFARSVICDAFPLSRLKRPGRLIIVDVRDPWMSKQESMVLGTLALQVLTRKEADQDYNTLVRIDELHELMGHQALAAELARLSRLRRHLGLSLLFTTQDPEVVPLDMLSNADLIALGRMQSREGIKWIARVKSAFAKVKPERAAQLDDGELLVWSEKVYAADEEAAEAVEEILDVQVRSQTAQHGGATHLAVKEAERTEG